MTLGGVPPIQTFRRKSHTMKKSIIGRSILLVLFTLFLQQASFAQGKTSTSQFEIKNEDLKAYVGQYDPESGFFSITVSLDGEDRLMAQPTDKSQPLTLMEALAKDKFELPAAGGIQFTFTRDENDKIISLTFSQNGQSFTAKRKE